MELKNKTILLIEDDLLVGKMYERYLLVAGARVIWAHDGKNGLEKLKKEKVDLVVTDLMMAKMDGYEVIQCIRKNKKTKNIPIIIFTNLTKRPEDVKKIQDFKIAEYIIKSDVTLKDLVKVISTVLRETDKKKIKTV